MPCPPPTQLPLLPAKHLPACSHPPHCCPSPPSTVMERPVAEGATLHFVDDRYETLHAVVEQAPELLQRCARGSWRLLERHVAAVQAVQALLGAIQPLHPLLLLLLLLLFAALPLQPELRPSRWKLYLADWGYNTADERAAAAKLPGVRLLSRPQFVELLRWGVVMEAS